jgi:hypothetical protein
MLNQHLASKLLLSVLVLPFAIFSACTPEERQFGTTGSGGASSSSSGGMQCSVDTDCGANSECQSFTCVDGTCNVTFTPMGTAVAIQALGDCQSNVCDGKGYIVNVGDLADPVDDGNPCTLDACVGTETQHGFLASGTACNGAQYCDGFGFCVECLDSSQCNSSICYKNACATPECSDMVKNGTETDIDCGGLQCSPCAPGLQCVGNPDCKSHVCEGGKCSAPTCTDNVQNGLETYADCGGPDCSPCADTLPCNAGIDCISQACVGNVCQIPACDDKVINGSESDVDCGGTCVKCLLGQGCYVNKDCSTNHCCPLDPNMPGYCEKLNSPCVLFLRSEAKE